MTGTTIRKMLTMIITAGNQVHTYNNKKLEHAQLPVYHYL